MSIAAILTAAGNGTRLGHLGPKAFVPVAGVPLLLRAARALLGAQADEDHIDQLVVTVPEGFVAHGSTLLSELSGQVDLWVVEGGPSRQASVAAGLATLHPAVDVVLVHDAARALAPPSLVARVIEAVRGGHGAVVPALPVVDTVKRVGPPGETGARPVVETPPRGELVSVQTPQGFDRSLLDRAHAAGAAGAGEEATAASDDASLVEALGEPVWVVPGDENAMKITTPADLACVERVLRGAA
ncbi:MAG: 2-C-methyl-D-erythritol 4-phosphate cytidylyltransferase [Micrococcales bacterium]|nr:2-C-methyl-D-erythritol 4-phosphate cytidylyltransferase [Micrococcales bacterium]